MKISTAILICAAALLCSCGQKTELACGDEIFLEDGWKLSSEDVKACKAYVPSTVAGALYDAGYYLEDLFESENYSKADRSIFEKAWTYETTFCASLKADHYELCFDGLGYYADIFLNGEQIASSDTTAGVFIKRQYDITGLLKERNTLSVRLQQAKTGDLNIGFVDWNPKPLDGSMGIVRPVHLHATGPVSIQDVYVKPFLDTEDFSQAELEVMVSLRNFSSEEISGSLELGIEDSLCTVPLTLKAGESKEVVLTSAQAANLHLDNPRVWWCSGLGNPELYELGVSFSAGDKISDRKDITFGVRTIESRLTEDNYRQFTLNGKDILIKGAGWTDDIFLRDRKEDIERQVLYVKDMNLNCIRFENIWGKDDTVYDLCDRYGLLAIVGWSCQWEWEDYCGIPEKGRFGCIYTPELMDLAVAYFRDQVKRLHNHVSLTAWLTGSDGMPMPELDERYKEIYDRYEYRPYVCSAKNLHSETSGWSGTKMDGPYEYVGPEYWYLDTKLGGAFGFNTETCTGASVPQKESILRMIQKDSLWPVSKEWDFHCTASSSAMGNTGKIMEVTASYYGEPTDVDDFIMKAHAVDYNGTRGMFEAFRANLGKTTGIVQWMLNSAWPSIYWQLYDWYGVPTAAYYGVKKACEPVQLIFNYKDRQIYAVNESGKACGLAARIKVLDADCTLLDEIEVRATVEDRTPLAVAQVGKWDGQPHFIALEGELEDGSKVDNFYCIGAQDNEYLWEDSKWYITEISRYSDLGFSFAGGEKEIECSVIKTEGGIEVTVTNKSGKLSYMNILKLKDRKGELIVPAFWSDNFFPLLPSQSKTVSCRFSEDGPYSIEIASK